MRAYAPDLWGCWGKLVKPPSFGAAFGIMVKNRRAELRMTQAQLAMAVWPASAEDQGESRKGDISKLEKGNVPNPHESTVLAICRALELDLEKVNALRLAPPPDPYALAKVLADLTTASQSDLYALARAFGDDAPERRSDAALRAFLADKAREHANYQKIIAALDDRVAAIANLKGAAQDAAARLDFDVVESLLSRVHEVELDIAAATAEARAENALMQGNAEKAFTLFSAAADSFAALGPIELARRRRTYAERLMNHGTRYGGTGLPLAIRLFDRLLTDLPQDTAPRDWAAAHNSLAIACQNLGERTDGPPGTALLARAVQAYEAALQVASRNDYPKEWAMTMQNLANALLAQGERTAGQDRVTQLSRAVAAYEQALEVRTRADQPVKWAMTMQNLANALAAQGERTEGKDGITLVSRAVAAYEQALLVLTRADHPVNWAMTQENLALCHKAWAQHPACDHPAAQLRQALAHVDAALTVYDPDYMPYDYGTATRLRERILSALADNP